MKPHEIAKLVNELTKVAKQYGQTQQLRERIAYVVVPALQGETTMHVTLENAHRQWATDEEYVAKAGCRCPACGSDDINGDGVEIGAGYATQECGCNQCDAEWMDTYRLTGYISETAH